MEINSAGIVGVRINSYHIKDEPSQHLGNFCFTTIVLNCKPSQNHRKKRVTEYSLDGDIKCVFISNGPWKFLSKLRAPL